MTEKTTESFDIYLTESERIFPQLCEKLRSEFPDYPDHRTLANLIRLKVVEDCKKSIEKGIQPSRRHEDEIRRKFEDYIYLVVQAKCRLLDKDCVPEKISDNHAILLIGTGFSENSALSLTDSLDSVRVHLKAKSFEEVSEKKDEEFKRLFMKEILGKKIRQTEAHTVIAEMFHAEVITEIISLNWDNLIEKAHDKFGVIRKINDETIVPTFYKDGYYHYLWKFSGDVDKFEDKWIYPGMKERVFQSFLEYIPSLMDHMYVFLLIGYSEREGDIKDKIIRPWQDSWPDLVYSIGMDLSQVDNSKNYMVAPANWIMPLLFKGGQNKAEGKRNKKHSEGNENKKEQSVVTTNVYNYGNSNSNVWATGDHVVVINQDDLKGFKNELDSVCSLVMLSEKLKDKEMDLIINGIADIKDQLSKPKIDIALLKKGWAALKIVAMANGVWGFFDHASNLITKIFGL